MYEESCFLCPLVGRDMWDAECYDVQMVRHGFIKSDILDFILDKNESDVKCGRCSFNQLKLPSLSAYNNLIENHYVRSNKDDYQRLLTSIKQLRAGKGIVKELFVDE